MKCNILYCISHLKLMGCQQSLKNIAKWIATNIDLAVSKWVSVRNTIVLSLIVFHSVFPVLFHSVSLMLLSYASNIFSTVGVCSSVSGAVNWSFNTWTTLSYRYLFMEYTIGLCLTTSKCLRNIYSVTDRNPKYTFPPKDHGGHCLSGCQ